MGEVRLRIDPMVAVDDWETQYGELVDTVFGMMKPNRITLGTLRGLTTTVIHYKDRTWMDYLSSEKSNWGKKSTFATRLAMYQFVIDKLVEKGMTDVGVCKETLEMWKALGKDFKKIKCNCTW